MDGDGSEAEVDVTVEALVDNVDDGISEPEVVAESEQPSERSEGSQADEVPNVYEVPDHEVDATSVSDNEVKPELPAGPAEISRSEVEEVGQISESEDPVNEINESETPPAVIKPEPRARHPELDPVKDPVEDVAENVSEPREAEAEAELPVEPVDPVVDPIEEDPVDPEPVDEPEEGGYTSASHSYHPGTDSEDEEESEEALQAELAQKEDEHNKLASQLQLMQREMEALRKILEQNQQELAMSSQETEG